MTQWGLDTLFNPAKRHMDEEKRRLQSTREQTGDSSGGRRIDLESGRVIIRRDATTDDASDSQEHSDAAVETATDTATETPAERRARLRRRPAAPAAPEHEAETNSASDD